MPTSKTPVEFTRNLDNGNDQLCGNRVQMEDENGNIISGLNPLPIEFPLGQELMGASVPVVIATDQSAIKTSDSGASWTSVFGVSGARFTSANQTASPASVTDIPTVGQKLVITDIIVSVDTAMRVDFKEETSGTIVLSIYLAANGIAQITTRLYYKSETAKRFVRDIKLKISRR